MSRCTDNGCNAPQGECIGGCGGSSILGYRRTECPYKDVPAEPERVSRLQMALNTWQLYRGVGCGLRESFRNALRAYRSNT